MLPPNSCCNLTITLVVPELGTLRDAWVLHSHRLTPWCWRGIMVAGTSSVPLSAFGSLTLARNLLSDLGYPSLQNHKQKSAPLRLPSNPQLHTKPSLLTTHTGICIYHSTTPVLWWICQYYGGVSIPQVLFLMIVDFYSQVTVIGSVFINIHFPFPSRKTFSVFKWRSHTSCIHGSYCASYGIKSQIVPLWKKSK